MAVQTGSPRQVVSGFGQPTHLTIHPITRVEPTEASLHGLETPVESMSLHVVYGHSHKKKNPWSEQEPGLFCWIVPELEALPEPVPTTAVPCGTG